MGMRVVQDDMSISKMQVVVVVVLVVLVETVQLTRVVMVVTGDPFLEQFMPVEGGVGLTMEQVEPVGRGGVEEAETQILMERMEPVGWEVVVVVEQLVVMVALES